MARRRQWADKANFPTLDNKRETFDLIGKAEQVYTKLSRPDL